MFSERHITRADIILKARVVGGIQMIDGGEADDKIVAVLAGDNIWGDVHDIADRPPSRPSACRLFLNLQDDPRQGEQREG